MICCSALDTPEQPELFDFDHIYVGSNASAPVAILYGALGTECFSEFHAVLAEYAKKVPLYVEVH